MNGKSLNKEELTQYFKDKLNNVYENDNQDHRLKEDYMNAMNDLYNLAKLGDFKLYRYVSVNTNSLISIMEQKIFLSPIGDMNDIFEGFFIDSKTDYNKSDMDKIKDRCYIKAFTVDNKSELMWSHYAKEHKGICIEYDLSMLARKYNNKDDEMTIWSHLFPVIYSNSRKEYNCMKDIVSDMNEINDAIKAGRETADLGAAVELYEGSLIKSKKWEYESEWRILFTKEELYYYKKNHYKDMIELPCISNIYLGYRISDNDEKLVKLALENINSPICDIRLYKEIINKDYSISFNQI